MSDQETQMKIKFLGKEKKLNFINDYNKFLEKCYKLFKIDENKKKNLKIYVLDEDDESELAIDNESDFKDQQVINEENNTITYILKLEGTSETNENEQLSEHQKQDNDNENNDNKKNDDTFEGNKGGVVNNEDKKDENNECKNNIDFSKIIESFKEENKQFQNEIIEKINVLTNMSKELKTSMKKSINDIKTFLMAIDDGMKKYNEENKEKRTNMEKELKKNVKKSITDVKTFLMTIDEGMKKNNEENKEKNTNMEKELKKNMKKSINDVKTFLIAMDEGMKKNNEQLLNTIYETKVQTQNNNNDKKLEEIKNEIINKIISLEETTNNFKKEFKNLENKFERMKEDIRKQNIIQSKKQEKEEFYGFENKNLSKNFNSSQSKGNDNNIILDSIFIDIKENLEVNYAISSEGLSDEELKDKIKRNLNNEIKEKLKSNKEEGIKKIAEIIYREVDL